MGPQDDKVLHDNRALLHGKSARRDNRARHDVYRDAWYDAQFVFW